MAHEHKWDRPHRGKRRCKYKSCRHLQFFVKGAWRSAMMPNAFATKWLPAISGTSPETMMVIRVAFPFEWNCYESWNIVYRVTFGFPKVAQRNADGLGTLTDMMNGWTSEWHEDFCQIDQEAEAFYKSKTGRDYDIGDNTYAAMRAVIQSPLPNPSKDGPSLGVVDGGCHE